ncbi:PEP-CTERM sorting domain-containing protein [Singulisphaera sp. PoT]|uniref:PEP-CTERM sorting domain-containing protein n=1 Tax=Singulisphaera sp. PoT TaxID=3411797 RepID=UPI003BF5AEE7
MNRRITLFGFGLCSLFALMNTPAHATPLPPSSTVIPDAQTNPLTEPGATLLDSITGNYEMKAGTEVLDSGVYKTWVVREASGTIDFLYQFTTDSSSQTAIEHLTMYRFAGFTTNVGYVANTGADGSTPANIVPDSANRISSGSVLAFNFDAANAVPAGMTSNILIIRTNAVSYTSGLLSIADGATTTVPAFAPGIVPEPSALALTAIGGLGLIGYSRRRSRAKA